jgi:hypothetical protein
MTLFEQIGGFVCFAAYIVTILGIPVLLIALAYLRRDKWLERRKGGLCVRCGYDLRESPKRCPECGEPAPFRGF